MGQRRLRATIETQYRDQGMRQAQADFDKTATGADRLNQNLERGGQASQSFGQRIRTVATHVAAAAAALGGLAFAAREGLEILEEGAELELAEQRFERLTARINTTADALLGRMREATKGMVSDAELIATGTDIIRLGLADTEDGTVRLARVISELGLDMQQVIMTFANDSVMRLDALGLSVEQVTTRAEELEDAGVAATEAFDQAVLEGLEANLAEMGSAAGSAAGDLRILRADWNDLVNDVKQGAADALGPALAVMSGRLTQETKNIIDERRQQLNSAAELVDLAADISRTAGEGGIIGDVIMGRADTQRQLNDLFTEIAAGSATFDDFVANVEEGFEVTTRYGNVVAETEVAQFNLQRAWERGREVFSELNEETLRAEQLQLRQHEALTRQNQTTQEAANVAETYTERLEEQGNMTEMEEALLIDLNAEQRVFNDLQETGAERLESTQEALDAASERVRAATEAQRQANVAFGQDFVAALDGANLTLDDYERQMIEAAAANGATREELVLLTAATGDFTEAQIEAALKAAAMADKAEDLGGAVADGTITIQDAIEELGNFQVALDEDYTMAYEDQSIQDGIQRVDTITEKLDRLNNMQVNVDININQTGSASVGGIPPQGGTGGSGGSGSPPPPPGVQQHGTRGRWVQVPAGFPNDSFPVWMSSGESFAVRTPQETAKGSGAVGSSGPNYTLIVNNNARTEDVTTDFRMMEALGGGV